MKNAIITLLYSLMRRYIGPALFVRVVGAVSSLLNADIPGAQKRAIVQDALQIEMRQIGAIAINAAIEIALLKLTTK